MGRNLTAGGLLFARPSLREVASGAFVGELLVAAREAVAAFGQHFRQVWDLRQRARRVLGKVTARDNIKFATVVQPIR